MDFFFFNFFWKNLVNTFVIIMPSISILLIGEVIYLGMDEKNNFNYIFSLDIQVFGGLGMVLFKLQKC